MIVDAVRFCVSTKRLYFPFDFSINSSCDPISFTCPSPMNAMRSALRMVESLCAMTMQVRSLDSISLSSASWTILSLSLSSADVASSSNKISGFFTRARAMATRCFCPPLSCVPDPPLRGVSKFSGNFMIKSYAFACLAASMICSFVASGAP